MRSHLFKSSACCCASLWRCLAWSACLEASKTWPSSCRTFLSALSARLKSDKAHVRSRGRKTAMSQIRQQMQLTEGPSALLRALHAALSKTFGSAPVCLLQAPLQVAAVTFCVLRLRQ